MSLQYEVDWGKSLLVSCSVSIDFFLVHDHAYHIQLQLYPALFSSVLCVLCKYYGCLVSYLFVTGVCYLLLSC